MAGRGHALLRERGPARGGMGCGGGRECRAPADEEEVLRLLAVGAHLCAPQSEHDVELDGDASHCEGRRNGVRERLVARVDGRHQNHVREVHEVRHLAWSGW